MHAKNNLCGKVNNAASGEYIPCTMNNHVCKYIVSRAEPLDQCRKEV